MDCLFVASKPRMIPSTSESSERMQHKRPRSSSSWERTALCSRSNVFCVRDVDPLPPPFPLPPPLPPPLWMLLTPLTPLTPLGQVMLATLEGCAPLRRTHTPPNPTPQLAEIPDRIKKPYEIIRTV